MCITVSIMNHVDFVMIVTVYITQPKQKNVLPSAGTSH